MAALGPDAAVAELAARLQRALSCVVRGVFVGSGAGLGATNGVTLFVEGHDPGGPVRLRSHGGNGDIFLQVAHKYEVVQATVERSRQHFYARTTFYHYDILDRSGNEIVVYHFEPEGISPVRLPHLHVPAAKSIVLPQRLGSALAHRQTHLGKLHLLTGQMHTEDVIEVLIREFAVAPLRADWETVLARGREQAESDR